jgi:ketosteroid isomerase-like protein
MERERAEHFASEWYAAWNAHDLEAILEHYADDVVMTSPLVPMLTGGDETGLSGKDALRAYFTAGLERLPDLHFEPIELFVGVDSLVMYYRRTGGPVTAEMVVLGEDGKVTQYHAHYA